MTQDLRIDKAVNLGSDQLAGAFGVMDLAQIDGFESGDVSNVVGTINGEAFRVLGADNANAFLTQIGVDQVVGLGGDKIVGLFSAVDGDQIQALSAD